MRTCVSYHAATRDTVLTYTLVDIEHRKTQKTLNFNNVRGDYIGSICDSRNHLVSG